MKNILSLTLAASVAASLLVTGCSKKKIEKEPDLYQTYLVGFSNEHKSMATASFRVLKENGSEFLFHDPLAVMLNGKIPNQGNGPGSSPLVWFFDNPDEATFAVKKANATIINKVSRSSMGSFALAMDTVLSISDTLEASWTGTTLQKDEYMNINMAREFDSTWTPADNISGSFTGQKCTFDFEKTKLLRPGIYTVTLTKIKYMPLQQADGNASGRIRVDLGYDRKIVIK